MSDAPKGLSPKNPCGFRFIDKTLLGTSTVMTVRGKPIVITAPNADALAEVMHHIGPDVWDRSKFKETRMSENKEAAQ